jgi:hypothetical protein
MSSIWDGFISGRVGGFHLYPWRYRLLYRNRRWLSSLPLGRLVLRTPPVWSRLLLKSRDRCGQELKLYYQNERTDIFS